MEGGGGSGEKQMTGGEGVLNEPSRTAQLAESAESDLLPAELGWPRQMTWSDVLPC